MVDKMTRNRQNVNYIPLLKEICKKIDSSKNRLKDEYNRPLYKSRPEFVEKAVLEKLEALIA
jgi:hypothetical protein